MDPSDTGASENVPQTSTNEAVEDSWSSDEEEGPSTAGYALLQNDGGSDEEESYFMATEDSVPSMDEVGDEQLSDTKAPLPNHGLKPITAEEEAQMRREAFENFDRNYETEMANAIRVAPNHTMGEIDSQKIASAMAGVHIAFRPAWTSFEDEQVSEIMKEVLRQHDIDWNPRSVD